MKHLYFTRHGLSEMNKAGLWSGQTETPLSREGREQAKLAGKRAKELHIQHIVSSTYARARDTAEIIAGELGYAHKDIELNSLFIERGLGVLEGQPWKPDINFDGIADIETTDTLQHRTELAYAYLQTLEVENLLVVGHGASGRMLRHIINPEVPFYGPESIAFPNAEIVQLL